MSNWREAHRKELLEKQRHISQKLAQLREFRALVKKWRTIIRNNRDWLKSLQSTLESSAGFSVETLARMGSITAQLGQLVGEFQQIGDPKTTGTGTVSNGNTTGTGTSVNDAQMTDRERATATIDLLNDRAGPLASMAPWELVWHIDPETSEPIRRGNWGVGVTNALLNPFTSLAGLGFAKGIAEQSQVLFEEHPEEFNALKKGWNDTNDALDSISDTLDSFDDEQLGQLEEGLENVLHDYESAYDGARGTDDTSARELRRAASGESTTR